MNGTTREPGPDGPRDGVEAAIFEAFLDVVDRPPSRAELAEWVGKLLRGIPVRDLRAILEASGERAMAGAAAADIRRLRASGLFDPAWYRYRYPDVAEAGMGVEQHYVLFGAAEDRAPNPWFDPVWYRASHGLAQGEDPLVHYVSAGEAQGLRPSPHFDPAWYRANYSGDTRRTALADFLRRRKTRTVAPCAAMWSALGLPDRPLTGVEDDVFLTLAGEPADWLALRGEGVFDENYYALHSGDVLASGGDPLRHYCEFGWRENRQPNFYFDSRWYAATNPEVVRLGVNPLAHYLLLGEAEGRRPIVFFDPVWYRTTYEVPEERSALAHFLEHRRTGKVAPNLYFDPVFYAERRGKKLRPGRDPFARFLVNGLTEDFSPSEHFDLPAWRRRNTGRVSRHFRHLLDPAVDDPLVRFLLSTYE